MSFSAVTPQLVDGFSVDDLPVSADPSMPGFPAQDLPVEWGHYLGPSRSTPDAASGAVRVAVFGSYKRGFSVLAHLLEERGIQQGGLSLVGLATDDTEIEDPFTGRQNKSKISAAKRVWRYVPKGLRPYYQGAIETMAHSGGMPAYCGPVKSEFFQKLVLPFWDPQLIVMATFGQVIDGPIINYPQFGMYNFHPSHLAQGKFPGPNPFQEMIDAGEKTTRMTLHHVSEEVDGGGVVGFSPEVRITYEDGSYPSVPELHNVTSNLAGRMVGQLVLHIMATRRRVEGFLDMESVFSDQEKKDLLKPVPPRTPAMRRILARL